MRKFLLFFVLLFTSHVAFPQLHYIKGRVVEKEVGALPSASVFLLQSTDSAVVQYTTTTTEGNFLLEDIREGSYIFKVSFLGYSPFYLNLTMSPPSDTLDMGTIALKPVASELQEVEVTGIKAPVTVKEDTVEYNAGSYTTRPNANVEQLLKKLPGLDVQSDGNISVQGERVTRIFVDGKEFFGRDLKTATKNLPADAIENVQVIDEQSQEARFSGIDDGRRQKVINLTLKEDRQNTGFGKATAGIGTSKRYMTQGNYNLLDEGNMLSVFGTSNNINNIDLSSGGSDAAKTGASASRSPGQNGLVNAHTGGANVFRQLTPKTSLTGSYLFNHTDATILSNLIRQNFLPEGTALYYEESRNENRNSLHNATAGVEHKDSINTVRLNANFGYSGARNASSSSRQSFSVADSLVYEGERTALTRNNSFNLDTDLFYGHRFGKSGRLFTLTNQFSVYQDDTKGRAASFTRFKEGDEEEVRQRNEQENKDLSYSLKGTYTEPLGNKQFLQATYDVSNRASKANLEVYDLVGDTSFFAADQSSRFSSTFLYQRIGLTYRLNQGKYNLSVGARVQQSDLARKVEAPDDNLERTFRNVLPHVNYNRRFSRSTRLSLDYTTSVREPSINQLQPVVSRYDPLHLYIGNPNLRPEYTHQAKLQFNTSDAASGIFLTSSLNYNYTTNPITAAVTIDERQVRTTQYVNVSQSNSLAAYVNVGVPVRRYNSRFNLSPYLRQGESVNLLNSMEGTITQRSVGANIGYAYTYKEFVDVNIRAFLTRTSSEYELNQQRDQVFVNAAYVADATIHFLKSFYFTADFTYSKFRNRQANFEQGIPTLNLSLSKLVLKDNRGEVRLSGLNMLNRNIGATQFATQNYIEQSVQNALGSFYMLSFTYNFNSSAE
ncbi:TonB-dependent receptor [Pontibacter diazotrophicus]|uniref:TonB-dependent receptor n=1 Tax=Pontibacter diazotrophicus TaxID=1400979 RepID=A0A3D8L2S9_9BACT|nr:outer membrane beta-barrel protein [Pontibacter diazotrophicus]RDV11302.1 TonB-dependent receptor [Pontibacter diazotrophicus]